MGDLEGALLKKEKDKERNGRNGNQKNCGKEEVDEKEVDGTRMEDKVDKMKKEKEEDELENKMKKEENKKEDGYEEKMNKEKKKERRHQGVVNHTGTSDGKFLEGNRISHGLSDAATSEACKRPLELSRTLSNPAGHSSCKRSGQIYLNSGTTSPSVFMKDTGQKKSPSGCPDNQEVDRWKWILHPNFTGTCKKTIFLAFLFSFMALSSGFNEDKHVYCHVHSEVDLPEWRLTCQFQEDLSESKQNFQVYRIKHAGSPDVVVDGTWIKDEPAVFTAVGYTHDGLISDKVVIKMQMEIVHHGGIYACVFPSEKLQNINTCQVPKKEELPSTRGTTYVPMTDEGTRLVAFKELLVATISLIIYESF